MKNLLLIALVILLVGCGDSSHKKSNNLFNRYHSALQAQKIGFVLERNRSGDDYEIDFNEVTKLFSTNKYSFKNKDREVVLKVDGDKIYKYVEHDYAGSISREVILQSISLEAKKTQEIMQAINFSRVGDRLVGSFTTDAFGDEYDTGTLKATISGGEATYSISVGINNVLCDLNSLSKTKGQVFISPTETTTLDTTFETTLGTCPLELTIDELKKINLTKIFFCDHSKNDWDVDCESEQDMSYLTAEL